jgi:hypothetical protein
LLTNEKLSCIFEQMLNITEQLFKHAE